MNDHDNRNGLDDDFAPADAADEMLVAYLDGQLPADECERIEARLASDAATRRRLQSLDRVWNALDALPRTTASPSFTRTTIDMAAVTAKKPSPDGGAGQAIGARWRPPARLLVGLGGLAAGVLLTLALVTAPERRAIQDLPVSLHASALENAGSVEFLQRLLDDAPQRVRRLTTDAVREEADAWSGLIAKTPAERRDWLADLPADRQAEVATAADRFSDRSAPQRESLRTLYEEVQRSPEAERLRVAALAYQSVVGRLPQGEQARLREMGVDERLAEVARQAERWTRAAALELSDSQREAFRRGVDELLASDLYRDAVERLGSRFPRVEDNPAGLLLFSTRLASRGGGPGGGWGRRRWPGGRSLPEEARRRIEEDFFEPMRQAWDAWADRLEASLPAGARGELDLAKQQGRVERARLLEALLRDALHEDLEDLFVDSSNDEIDRLLLLPRDGFADALTQQSDGGFDLFSPRDRRFGPPGGRPDFDRQGPPPGPPRGGGPPPDRFGPPAPRG